MIISDLARDLNTSASQIIDRLKKIGIGDISTFSNISADYAKGIKKLFSGKITSEEFKALSNSGAKNKPVAKGRVRKKITEKAPKIAVPTESKESDGKNNAQKNSDTALPPDILTDAKPVLRRSRKKTTEESTPTLEDNSPEVAPLSVETESKVPNSNAIETTSAPSDNDASDTKTTVESPEQKAQPSGTIVKRILKKSDGSISSDAENKKPEKNFSTHGGKDDWDDKTKFKALKKDKKKFDGRSFQKGAGDTESDSVIIKKILKRSPGKNFIKKRKKHTFNARKKDIVIGATVEINELAGLTGIRSVHLIKALSQLGHTVGSHEYIDSELAQLIASEKGVEITVKDNNIENTLKIEEDRPEDLQVRPPVVTIMGHVDHGKTSLLDFIRRTNVIDGESGGITQHIGAYFVNTDSGEICFLDTPGHEAFTAMRMRGANATDIVVLIVAADDGPMPQTIEAINHAKAADVPIIVAINKCDKPDANPEKTTQQLMEHGLVSEEFGGDTSIIKISAATGSGVNDLMDMINLQADVLELKSNPNRMAEGVVIESKISKGHGIVATLLVQKGTLNKGDYLVVGTEYGRVRLLLNDAGKAVSSAGPSMPIEILGLSGLPKAGDRFQVNADEKTVKTAAEARKFAEKEQEEKKKKHLKMEDFFAGVEEGKKNIMNLIVKGDVIGSVEAIADALLRIGNDQVGIKILHASVGAISNSDITLASASNAIVIGFNVRPDANAKKASREEHVEIKIYNIIYNIIDDITQSLEGMLDNVVREDFVGRAEILEIFNITGVGIVAGCKVVEGKAVKDLHVRILRDNIVIKESALTSLKRFKDEVKEVQQGFECGIGLEHSKDLLAKDTLEFFKRTEESGKL